MANNGLYSIKLPEMDYNILLVTDCHLTYTEFTGTVGYVPDVESSLLRIVKGAEEGHYNMVIFLGDLFDRAYKDVSKAFYHVSLIERLNKAVGGRVFKVLGNHPLNKDKGAVPTFFLVGEIKSGRIEQETMVVQQTNDGFIQNYGLKNPLLHCPDRIVVNNNVINLFHFNRYNKNYYDNLEGLGFTPNKHIGCYHDGLMSNVAKRFVNELSNFNKFDIPTMTTLDNTDLFRNIDFAMVGDIHTRIGEFEVYNKSTDKLTIVDIPGSIGRTANTPAQHHNFVDLPLLNIKANGEVNKKHIRMNLKDYRDIFKMEEQESKKELNKQMEVFKEAIFELNNYSTLKELVLNSPLEENTKEILLKLERGESCPPKYRQEEKNTRYL